ncbi:recombinase family protein [Micromonospora sp. NIE79]|uniref:Recombinase family protein n=1 Tax=Micromonospora trifolii TaxID=2911208 RepID=A0ABS9N937_9ACTN|nr:recombinase family protein [Micromonospora trifolii]MCG5446479.1 recombinase family protein [Micromonospora trifolii]
MSLKEWAAATGVSYATARRRYESGTLPVPAYRLGRLSMVGEPMTSAALGAGQVVVYARVSSADQEPDLDRQLAQVTVWATGHRLAVDRVVTEVGSALNGHSEKFLSLLRDVSETLTSLYVRLYGRRAGAGRVRRAVEAVTEVPM